jgi:hypothetical protein
MKVTHVEAPACTMHDYKDYGPCLFELEVLELFENIVAAFLLL